MTYLNIYRPADWNAAQGFDLVAMEHGSYEEAMAGASLTEEMPNFVLVAPGVCVSIDGSRARDEVLVHREYQQGNTFR